MATYDMEEPLSRITRPSLGSPSTPTYGPSGESVAPPKPPGLPSPYVQPNHTPGRGPEFGPSGERLRPAAPSAPGTAVVPSQPQSKGIAVPGGRVFNLLGRTAGVGQMAAAGTDMAEKGATSDNVLDASLGLMTAAHPALGAIANAAYYAPQAVANLAGNLAVKANDIRGPETMAYLAKLNGAAPGTAAPAVARATAPATGATGLGLPPQLAKPLTPPEVIRPGLAPNIQPQLFRVPGALPTLQANQDQSIFSAILNYQKDAGRYLDGVVRNKTLQRNFNNQLKAAGFNMDAFGKIAKVATDLNDDERKSFDQQLKGRAAEALRLLSTGEYEKSQEQGLRLLAGLEKGKYHPAVVYGQMDPATGVQQKMTVAVREDGAVVPINVPNFDTPNTPKALPPGMTKLVKYDKGKAVYEDAKGKLFIAK